MNSIKINEHVKNLYPSAVFGSLLVLNVPNKRQDKKLEERKIQLKNDLENNIKKSPNDELILHHYKTYFKRWNKSYPVDLQIQSIRKGKNLPQVSVLVDSMFHAELKNVILTSGHNVDELNGDLEFDISTGDEQYIKIDGNFQQLKEGDILLHDNKDILANILYGPSKRGTITMQTLNVLYLAWCPTGIDNEIVKVHLEDIISNLEAVYGSIRTEISIL